METSLVILKPDAVDRRLVGRILQRFEEKGLQIRGMKLCVIPRATAQKHYAEHKDKPFFDSLLEFITGGPAVLLAIGGNNAIASCRRLMGDTAGFKAQPGTIRGDFGLSGQFNLVHGSDSPQAAASELELFFRPEELLEYRMSDSQWFE